jgi:hypothetical protein
VGAGQRLRVGRGHVPNGGKGGYLEVLQWARANGCEWDTNTCREAAYSGHLEVLQWARANGCEWDAGTCYHAAYSGHLLKCCSGRDRADCMEGAPEGSGTREWIQAQPA